MVNSNDFQKAIELINKSSNVLLTSHTRPDGDACGSVRAMCDWLESLGKEVNPLFLSPLAQWYECLFPAGVPILGNDIMVEELGNGRYKDCDLVIIVDTNSYVQLPGFEEWLKGCGKKVLVIDHHKTSDGLGDFELVDSSAAAAGEIVFELIKHANWPLTKDAAEAIFIAISTDTGWFKFSNTGSRIYRIAAELIDAGAEPSEIYQRMYQNFSPARLKLMVRMLSSIELLFDNRLALQHILRKDFDETGSTGKDTEGMISECQRINTVEAAALFVELEKGFRCSLRSKGKVDVRKIAQKFGGGGHTNASGVTLVGSLKECKKQIAEAVSEQLACLDA